MNVSNTGNAPNSATLPVVNGNRTYLLALAMIALNAGVAILAVLSNSSNPALIPDVKPILLWLILPFGAVFLMWKGGASGRWILLALFGLRTLAEGSFVIYAVKKSQLLAAIGLSSFQLHMTSAVISGCLMFCLVTGRFTPRHVEA